MLRTLLCTACAILPIPLLAQEAENPLDLGTVRFELEGAIGPDGTVVATRTATASRTDTPVIDVPAAVSVVTEAELERRDVEDTTDALSYTSSVSTDEYGSDDRYDYVRIRGFYQAGLGTYRDGLPSGTTNFTGGKLEPFGLQRIEVLKGSTSTLFGLNTPGGLVNAITKRPQDQPFGESTVAVGPEHLEFGLDVGRPLDAAGEWTYRLTALSQDGDNGAEYTEDDRVYVAPALTWKPSNATEITLLADYSKRDGNPGHAIPVGSDIDFDTFLGEPGFNAMDREEVNLGWDASHRFSESLTFRQTARYTTLDLTYESIYGAGPTAATPRSAYAVYGELERFAINNQLQYDATLGRVRSRTLVGLDYVNEDVSETFNIGTATGIDPENPVFCGRSCVTITYAADQVMNKENTGVFLQEELTVADRWILTLGSRYDMVTTETGPPGATTDFEDEAFTSRAGLTYKATPDLSLYGNYSESFQPTGSYDRGLLATGVEPQEGTQYEVGAKYRPLGGNALLTASLFDLAQTNLVTQVAPAVYEQVGETRVRGAEVEGKWAMGQGLSLTAAYAYWDAEIVENGTAGNEGNRPMLVPEHTASLWADYTVPGEGARGDLTVGGGLRYTGPSFSDNANTIEIEGIAVVDAAVSYQVTQDVALALNVSNLFDQREIASVDTFTNNAYYNDGREVRARLTYSW
ncbi:TonB-dependent siderophore receptor [Rubellimicrobium rubrum]|nr:TonB-dependent siderophore receptor [Rubellimicrobium rubrum]